MPVNSLGWGLREDLFCRTVGIASCYCLPPSICHVQWSQVPLLSSVGSAWEAVHRSLLFLSGCMHLFVPLAQYWKFGGESLPAAPLLLSLHMLPELQHVRQMIPLKPWLGNSSSTKALCLCAPFHPSEERETVPCWTGPLSSCWGLLTQEVCVAEPLCGTFVKHALTVCKCTVFKQQSLYYQMQSCSL